MLDWIKENRRILAFFVIFVFAWWLTNSLTTVMHEEAHREICLKKNGTAEVTYYWTGLGGETYCSTTEGEDLHMMNEIVGYNVSSVVNSMFVVLFLWVVYDQFRRR